ncbi:MAG: alpha-glucosidase/alpha-galactosidase, partial [bacterium]
MKITYIGGGSKMWARIFMQDLALAEDFSGTVALYDIDLPAARRNELIGNRMEALPAAKSRFTYQVFEELGAALEGADFVLISILPGTFAEMRSDVHAPEACGIFQSVGDTVGPGGVLRAMRTVPLYEGFAKAIETHCPNAWVINLTNPMTACVKALYDNFPQIKAFGCCHEVFHTQDLLCAFLREKTGENVSRREIYTDASGINHFTWITEARWREVDLLALLPEFYEKYHEVGIYPKGTPDQWMWDTFASGNLVKLDLWRRYGALAAAGDRHLVEFLDAGWYLSDPARWHFARTPVSWREEDQRRKLEESITLSEGRGELTLAPSGEELVRLMRGILGYETVVSNVNLPNVGQMQGLPLGSIVETNCVFTHGFVKPIAANPLPAAVLSLVRRNSDNIDLTCSAIRERDPDKLLAAFMNQPLCAGLAYDRAKTLFFT